MKAAATDTCRLSLNLIHRSNPTGYGSGGMPGAGVRGNGGQSRPMMSPMQQSQQMAMQQQQMQQQQFGQQMRPQQPPEYLQQQVRSAEDTVGV